MSRLFFRVKCIAPVSRMTKISTGRNLAGIPVWRVDCPDIPMFPCGLREETRGYV